MKHNLAVGFTIVELVVVISVISILAGISIGGYGAWRNSVATKEVKTDISSFQSAMKAQLNFAEDGKYPAVSFDSSDPSKQTSTVFTPSPNVLFDKGTSSDGLSYCVNVSSKAKPDIKYYLTSSTTDPQAGSTSCPT